MNKTYNTNRLFVIIALYLIPILSISQGKEILNSTTWFEYDRLFEEYVGLEKIVYEKGEMLNYYKDYDSAYITKLYRDVEMYGGNEIGLDTIIKINAIITDSTISTPYIEYDIDRSLLPDFKCDYVIGDSIITLKYDIFNFDNNYTLVIYDVHPLDPDDMWLKFYFTRDTVSPIPSTNNFKFASISFKGFGLLDTIAPEEWTAVDTNCLYKNDPTRRYSVTGYVEFAQCRNENDTNLIAYVVNNKYLLGLKYVYNNDVSSDTSYRALAREISKLVGSDTLSLINWFKKDKNFSRYDNYDALGIRWVNSYNLLIRDIQNDKPVSIELTNKLWTRILTAFFYKPDCSYDIFEIFDR